MRRRNLRISPVAFAKPETPTLGRWQSLPVKSRTHTRIRVQPDELVTLAVARVVICALVLLSDELRELEQWTARGLSLAAPAEGVGWALPALGPLSAHAGLVRGTTSALLVLGVVGLLSRFVLPAAALLTTLVYAVPHFAGTPRHSMHLVWFLWILALTPSAARLSLDQLRLRGRLPAAVTRRQAERSLLGVGAMRIGLAAIYFFPGFWKLAEGGLGWVFSDNLQNQMYWKWFQFGSVPRLRIDAHPTLVQAGAAGVVAFELGFVLLLLSRRTRLVAAAGGFLFHQLADRFLYLPYGTLWWCYVVLIDWRAAFAWLTDARAPRPTRPLATLLPHLWRARPGALLACALLSLGPWVQGARGAMQAYPFACYPTFQWRAGPHMPDLLITRQRGAEVIALRDSPFTRGTRAQVQWGMAWRAAGVYGEAIQPARLLGYFATLPPQVRREVTAGDIVRFYRVSVDVRPGHWQELAGPPELLHTWSYPGP